MIYGKTFEEKIEAKCKRARANKAGIFTTSRVTLEDGRTAINEGVHRKPRGRILFIGISF